jgi:hypothetical protein
MTADPGRGAPLAMISALLFVGGARAETQVAGFLGMSWTTASNVAVGGQTFHGVSSNRRPLRSTSTSGFGEYR